MSKQTTLKPEMEQAIAKLNKKEMNAQLLNYVKHDLAQRIVEQGPTAGFRGKCSVNRLMTYMVYRLST